MHEDLDIDRSKSMEGGAGQLLSSSPVWRATISEHPGDRFSPNTCDVGVNRFTLTFFNSLKLTYHNNHPS